MRILTATIGIILAPRQAIDVQAFLPQSNRVSSPSFGVGIRWPSPRFALVFGDDGTVSEEYQGNSNIWTAEPSSPLPPNIVESLSSKLTMPLLVRLGCAFAPPPHDSLRPHKVESASLVSVDATKLEIAVAIPSEGSLIQIVVPVVFPTPCDTNTNGALEASIVEIIEQMDGMAIERIGDSERSEDNYEELADQSRILQALKEEPYADDLPDWWTFANLKISLEEECRSMKSLLNEDDFTADLQALCRVHGVSKSEILQVGVAAVGPSGLFLRARVDKGDPVDVAVSFQKEAMTADELRTAVLDVVESLEEPSIETVAIETVSEEEGQEDEQISMTPATSESFTKEALSEDKEGLAPENIRAARKQPKAPEEEVRLAARYAAIEDVGERAYAILKDLFMV